MPDKKQEKPSKAQGVTNKPGVTETTKQRVPKDESELHGEVPGCKNWEERDNCEIFASLAPGLQCPKCKFWTKNIGVSD